jgi:hypothetical protein
MQRNLELTSGLIVTEAVMMGLAPKLGRQQAHDVVYDACRAAAESGRSLLELLCANDLIAAHLDRGELERLLDPLGLATGVGHLFGEVHSGTVDATQSVRQVARLLGGTLGLKSLRLVKVFSSNCSVRQNRHASRLHLKNTACNEDQFFGIRSTVLDPNCARPDSGNKRDMAWQDAQLARLPG